MARKPRVFVGSSGESLDVAYAVQESLDREAEVTVWTQGVMRLSRDTVASLQAILRESDFGVFVLGPDDLVVSRHSETPAPRDNVIFELGMFAGHLGMERSLIVTPRIDGGPPVKLPSDLAGVSVGEYDAQRSDGNLRAALGPATNLIRAEVREFVPPTSTAQASQDPAARVASRAAVGIRDERLGVFEVRKGRLRYRWFLDWQWTPWSDLQLPDGVHAVQVGAGSHGAWFDLLVASHDGGLYHCWWGVKEGWSEWTEWDPGVSGQIAFASLGDHHNEVWVTRNGSSQHQWFQDQSWSGWHDVDEQR